MKDNQEEAFGKLVEDLQCADIKIAIEMAKGALGENEDTAPKRAAITAAREALSRVQATAKTPRQKKLAQRALGYEDRWRRYEQNLDRIEALERGVLLPIC